MADDSVERLLTQQPAQCVPGPWWVSVFGIPPIVSSGVKPDCVSVSVRTLTFSMTFVP